METNKASTYHSINVPNLKLGAWFCCSL